MKIFGVPLSVHTRKVIVAAQLKGIPFELQVVTPVVPSSVPSDWNEISPTGLIPAIEDRGFVLADSTAIIHYIERRNPTPALLSADAIELGTTLFLDAWAGSALFRNVVHPLFHNQIVNPNIRKVPADHAAIDTAMNKAAPTAFGYLESLDPKDFLIGNSLSLADLAVVSNLIVFHYLGRRIDPQYPKLNAYFQRHIASPLLSKTLTLETEFAAQMGLDRSFIR